MVEQLLESLLSKNDCKKYDLKFLSSGLLYRYAAYIILKYQPTNKILFLKKNLKT